MSFLLPAGHVAEALEEGKSLLTPFQQITREVAEEHGLVFVSLQHRFDEFAQLRGLLIGYGTASSPPYAAIVSLPKSG